MTKNRNNISIKSSILENTFLSSTRFFQQRLFAAHRRTCREWYEHKGLLSFRPWARVSFQYPVSEVETVKRDRMGYSRQPRLSSNLKIKICATYYSVWYIRRNGRIHTETFPHSVLVPYDCASPQGLQLKTSLGGSFSILSVPGDTALKTL